MSRAENTAWLRRVASDFADYARDLDPGLWSEAEAAGAELVARGQARLRDVPAVMGGAADCRLLYFAARRLRPATVLETGVAAGFSSLALLEALERNGSGALFSSDFPYPRIENSARYVGVVVDERLRSRWTLEIEGDAVNLPRLLDRCGPIQLFHYDSDKSYAGRRRACDLVVPRLAPGAVLIMDDIEDNAFFHDLVGEMPGRVWRVFRFGRKYIGMVGDL
jgi:predicted O-methyltransferase YrrM